ncbi:hypothetical protein FRC08_018228 [Ceratobasidium sp. 394]|nr:hypothetical protein FRC08_018228 [Ceratobasidium sp. 394]
MMGNAQTEARALVTSQKGNIGWVCAGTRQIEFNPKTAPHDVSAYYLWTESAFRGLVVLYNDTTQCATSSPPPPDQYNQSCALRLSSTSSSPFFSASSLSRSPPPPRLSPWTTRQLSSSVTADRTRPRRSTHPATMGTVTAAVIAEPAGATQSIAARSAASAARLISAANTGIIAIVRSGEVDTSAAVTAIVATIRSVYMTATGRLSYWCTAR